VCYALALHGCSDRFWEPFVAKIGGDYLSDIKKCNVLTPLNKTLKHAFMYGTAMTALKAPPIGFAWMEFNVWN
jgi:hypothetical protein